MQVRDKMRILWITPKWPFPVADGARIATTQLLKQLTAQGASIHLVSMVPEDEVIQISDAETTLGIKDVTLIRRPTTTRAKQLTNFLKTPFIPITFSPFASLAIAKQIKRLLRAEAFDLLVYDGLHTAAWKYFFFAKGNPYCAEAYRAHNVESEIWIRAARDTANPLKKILLFFQGKMIERFEKKLVREAAYVFPVSTTDAAKFAEYGARGKIETIPIGIEVTPPPRSHIREISEDTKRKLLFVGKLDWAPNRDGLKWVLDKVWPKVMERTQDITLTIVGSGERRWLEPYENLPGLNIIGQVDSVSPFYEDCLATIVPVFYGSGTRVKAIESSLHGRVCISTQIGVEGMGLIEGENYHRAEQESDWIHTLTFLEAPLARQMGERASVYAKKAFDPAFIADRFLQSVSWGKSI